MTETTMTRKLTFNDSVIEKIAGIVGRSVEGILSLNGGKISELADKISNNTDPTKGVKAEVGEKQVALDMAATIEFGADARRIFDEVCEKIQTTIKNFTGLDVVELNLNIDNVMTKKGFQSLSSRQKDEIATATITDPTRVQ